MKYMVILEQTKTGYSAYSPDLPGCVATGASRDDAEKRMKEAIAFHLDGLHQDGLEIPQPHSLSTYLDVSA